MFSFNNQVLIAPVICSILLIIVLALDKRGIFRQHRKPPQVASDTKPKEKDVIEPILDLDLDKVEPIKYRPYNTIGYVAMGINQKTRQDWIHIDRGYLARIKERERVLEQHPETVIHTGPIVDPAIEELYTEIMIDYLPRRYPTIFKTSGNIVHNTVTGYTYPLSTKGMTTDQMLRHLCVNVEDDFFFMCPDGDGDFRLQGYIGCFTNGFLAPSRLGESLREIHQPVPGYEQRLGKGADKIFQRFQPGQFISRMNWSLQVDGNDLFRTGGLNYYPDKDQTVEDEKFNPDFDRCYLRAEHQTLTCLAKSGAIMFCVRSYLTPLHQIKAEGEGPRLAAVIEGMPEKLGIYKMRPFWGAKVLPWLKDGPHTSSSPVA